MRIKRLTEFFVELEGTTLRNQMVEILSRLFTEIESSSISELCYLLQGRVVPLYEPLEFGVADKLMVRAISLALAVEEKEIWNLFKKEGDFGSVTTQIKEQHLHAHTQDVTVHEVYEQLLDLAQTAGDASQEKKMSIISDLLVSVDPLSAGYIVRMVLGKLRLGFSDATILEALSWMLDGSKSKKKTIEAAYNVRPDLGYIARAIKEKGIQGIAHVSPVFGTPILMARANRLSSSSDIIEKIGSCAVEYKYDGLRMQVHYKKFKIQNSKCKINEQCSEIKMFSRNLEDVTPMFPDIAQAVIDQIHADEVIFEGEIVAYNPHTGVFVPFQETMQRKRKHGIEEKAAEIPVKFFAFELLYCDGDSYISLPYEARKKKLQHILDVQDVESTKKAMEAVDPEHIASATEVIVYAQEIIATSEDDVEDMFADSVKKHFEGIIAKRLDGMYEAGARGWNWIKYKKAMNKKLTDTIDVVVMGYTLGEGKRTSFGVGQFLTGVYDASSDRYVTVSKIGTGLTDEQFREFIRRVKPLEVKEKPSDYDVEKLLVPDVWVSPALVVEVSCDEVTRSAVHTAGREMEPSKSGKALSVKTPGYALRFPRLERFRDDKRAEDATTVEEVSSLYDHQK